MSKKQALLQAAEKRVRTGGYDNFSFRDLANDVGIKSASVHYHFPTKAELGVELVRSYTQRFFDNLGEPNVHIENGISPISAYIDMFRHALVVEQQMCLCGLLGAETDGLPDEVKRETTAFFEKNIDWLKHAFELTAAPHRGNYKEKAIQLLCALEGAILVSKSLGNDTVFETVAAPFLKH